MQKKKLRFKEHKFSMKSEKNHLDKYYDDLFGQFIKKYYDDYESDCIKKFDIKLDIARDGLSLDVILYMEYYKKVRVITKKMLNDFFKEFGMKVTSKINKQYKKKNIFGK